MRTAVRNTPITPIILSIISANRASGPWLAFAVMAQILGVAKLTPTNWTAISKTVVSLSNMCLKAPITISLGTKNIRIGRLKWGCMTAHNPICFSCMSNRCAAFNWPQKATGSASPPIISESELKPRLIHCRSGIHRLKTAMSTPKNTQSTR